MSVGACVLVRVCMQACPNKQATMIMTGVRAKGRGKCMAGKSDLRDQDVVNRLPGGREGPATTETSDRLGGCSLFGAFLASLVLSLLVFTWDEGRLYCR